MIQEEKYAHRLEKKMNEWMIKNYCVNSRFGNYNPASTNKKQKL